MKTVEKKPISVTNLRKAEAQHVYIPAWNMITLTMIFEQSDLKHIFLIFFLLWRKVWSSSPPPP